MSDWPNSNLFPLVTITPWSLESLGPLIAAVGGNASPGAAAAWPASNTALFVPFLVLAPCLIVKMASFNGGTVSGNIDVGIYDERGTKLVSSGSTAQAGTNAWQSFDITDTLLGVGRFYLATAIDNTTGTLFRATVASAVLLSTTGVCQMASAFPLPATVTLATLTANTIPNVIATGRLVV